MAKTHILFMRRRHTDLLAPVKKYTSQASAEEAGNYIYNELALDTIVVAEARFDHTLNKICYTPVYKRIRTCKHPNIQGDLFEGLLCQDCKMVIKKLEKEVIVSKVEDIKEEFCDEDDESDEIDDTPIETTQEYFEAQARRARLAKGGETCGK